MITDSFDTNSKAIINPEDVIEDDVKILAKENKIDTIILVFSNQLIDELLNKKEIEIIDERLAFGTAAGKSPVYRIPNTNTAVFLNGIGATMAAGMIEELYAAFGCKKYIVFGSCGVLVELDEGNLIIPTEAYRDEGMSYHYVKASDYITVKNSDKLANIFDKLDVDYVKGKVWTTDAIYRETIEKKDKRVAEGCLCVEMECSALQAVCDFRGLDLYHFVYAADSLNGKWARRILGDDEFDHRLIYFYLAKQISEMI